MFGDLVYHNNQSCEPRIRKFFKDGEIHITWEELQNRRKKECIRVMFLKRLEKMCEGVHKYNEDNEHELRRKREKLERKRQKLEELMRNKLKMSLKKNA